MEDDRVVSSNTRPDADKPKVEVGLSSGKQIRAIGVTPSDDKRIYTMNDLAELIMAEDVGIIEDLFQAERHRIKFDHHASPGAKKKAMEKLRDNLWATHYELGKYVWPMNRVKEISKLCMVRT